MHAVIPWKIQTLQLQWNVGRANVARKVSNYFDQDFYVCYTKEMIIYNSYVFKS